MVVEARDTTHGDVDWVTATVPVMVVEANVVATVFVTNALTPMTSTAPGDVP
jgi:hypothetical protein